MPKIQRENYISSRASFRGAIDFLYDPVLDDHRLDSEDDENGSDPFVRNGEFRFLAGYEQELARNLTGSVQYYLEHMLDYGEYKQSLFPGTPKADENPHMPSETV